jgi:hypothetical protein
MKRSTYIICLAGHYHALAADLFLETVQDLETGAIRSGIRSCDDRNRAIMAITRPLSWRSALDLAQRSGNYVGQLISNDSGHIWPL